MRGKSFAYIGLGSNIGDRKRNIQSAIELIDTTSGLKVVKQSSIHETNPVGGPPQGKYLNAAVKIECDLKPRELLKQLMRIENELGRKRTGKNHPRTIDLDILMIDDCLINMEKLTVPHPRLTEREFALAPLAELAPEQKHPVSNLTIIQHLENLKEQSRK